MRIGIRSKLAIAVAAIAVAIALIVFLSMLFSFRSGFLQYVNASRFDYLQSLKATIESSIETEEQWQHFLQQKKRWDALLRQTFRENRQQNSDNKSTPTLPGQRPPRPNAFYLLDNNKAILYGKQRDVRRPLISPIKIDNQRVGFIGVHKSATFNRKADKSFVAKQTKTFFMIAIIVAILGAIAAFCLAHWMVSPVQRLNRAMKQLTTHDYNTRVENHSKDEMGELMHSFNRLAITLGEHEKSQQRWIADISHELRTPLATLRGEIEALQDGIRKLTPSRIDSLHEEIIHIQRIVDDLHQLTLSDLGALKYQFSECDVVSVIQKIQLHNEAALNKKSLEFTIKTDDKLPLIEADEDRLHQLFANLMQNSLRYTDAGGAIEVSITKTESQLSIHWQDSSPGVDTRSHGKLFNRLYREESSRNRAQGGSGLGLSIVQAIASAHLGSVATKDASLGGLEVILTLPLHLN